VLPSQKIKLYIDDSTPIPSESMADQHPVGYWESLGPNSPFLWLLFMSQQEQVQQLWDTNTFLQSQVADTHDDITNEASATASAVAQAITTTPQPAYLSSP